MRAFLDETLKVETHDLSLSKAGRDKLATTGQRSMYGGRDLDKPVLNAAYNPKAVVTLVDTDGYVPAMRLSTIARGRPMFIWGLHAEKLAGKDGDGTFYFKSPHVIVEAINGGAVYESLYHKHEKDLVAMSYKWYGIPMFTVYNVATKHQPGSGPSLLHTCRPRITTYHCGW